MPPAIRVENISKSYRVGQISERGRFSTYKTLRESVSAMLSEPVRRWRSGAAERREDTFWALKDISFEVQPGEVVGIVGRNGAGKSTLLKIVCGITSPTRGEATIYGRIGSLLEVGTGFHPELTGRENIFLNGSVLGMSRSEIRERFDAIVDFSGVERFLETPVKRYSTGMQVRLAFAVAAHLEPEILIVDEVLAVGDIAFQNKCLARMQDVTRGGRTVLFVSHNMTAVQSLCKRALLLGSGSVVGSGSVSDVVAEYLSSMSAGTRGAVDGKIPLTDHPNRSSSSRTILHELQVLCDGRPAVEVPVGASIRFRLKYELPLASPALSVVMFLSRPDGQRLIMLHSRKNGRVELTHKRAGMVEAELAELPLLPGTYRIDLAVVSTGEVHDYIEHATDLRVVASDYFGTGELPSELQGVFALKSRWNVAD